jgi:hypothetical protein
LAVGQLSSTGGRRNVLELPGDLRSELAVAARNVLVCEPGFVSCVSLQVGALGAVPRCASDVGLVPGYRVDAPCAEREVASASACLAGAPQRRATTKRRAGKLQCRAARAAHLGDALRRARTGAVRA